MLWALNDVGILIFFRRAIWLAHSPSLVKHLSPLSAFSVWTLLTLVLNHHINTCLRKISFHIMFSQFRKFSVVKRAGNEYFKIIEAFDEWIDFIEWLWWHSILLTNIALQWLKNIWNNYNFLWERNLINDRWEIFQNLLISLPQANSNHVVMKLFSWTCVNFTASTHPVEFLTVTKYVR